MSDTKADVGTVDVGVASCAVSWTGVALACHARAAPNTVKPRAEEHASDEATLSVAERRMNAFFVGSSSRSISVLSAPTASKISWNLLPAVGTSLLHRRRSPQVLLAKSEVPASTLSASSSALGGSTPTHTVSLRLGVSHMFGPLCDWQNTASRCLCYLTSRDGGRYKMVSRIARQLYLGSFTVWDPWQYLSGAEMEIVKLVSPTRFRATLWPDLGPSDLDLKFRLARFYFSNEDGSHSPIAPDA